MAMWFPANREWVELPAVQRWKEGTDGFAAAGNRPWHQFIDAYYGVGEACSYFTSSAFCPNSCVWTHDACEEQTPTVDARGKERERAPKVVSWHGLNARRTSASLNRGYVWMTFRLDVVFSIVHVQTCVSSQTSLYWFCDYLGRTSP